MLVTVTLKCSLLLMVTVTLQCTVLLMVSHSAPYRRSAVVLNVSGPRTASRQNDAAASHSCHFNTVLCPRSYSQCQLPLYRSCRYITGAAFSAQIIAKFSQSRHYLYWHLCRPVNIYIFSPDCMNKQQPSQSLMICTLFISCLHHRDYCKLE